MDKEEITSSVYQMIQRDGEKVIKAVADACSLISRDCNRELDGTSEQVWDHAAKKIDEVYKYLEEN